VSLLNYCLFSNRTILGFWAGHRNSKIRVILARVWENDTELAISNNRINRATGPLIYQKRFYNTKFCICPGGSQVNSARIMDSIHYGCIPGENLNPFVFFGVCQALYKVTKASLRCYLVELNVTKSENFDLSQRNGLKLNPHRIDYLLYLKCPLYSTWSENLEISRT
jgi:Exostosin family